MVTVEKKTTVIMVAVIDQRVIKCRVIGEFSYSVIFQITKCACVPENRPSGTPQAALLTTLNSSMFSESADKS